MCQNGSDAPRASGQDGSSMEASAHHSFRKTTLLRWHRQGFKLSWKYKSRGASAKPKIAGETISLVKEMVPGEQNVHGANSSRLQSSRQQADSSEVHEIRAHVPCQEDRSGTPSCTRMPSRSGPAIFFRSTSLFFRSLAGLLHGRTALAQSDARRRDTQSH
jgi:hypothetical protein